MSIDASHAPNQISPAWNQTSAVYIGPVIIDRSLMAKIYKNLVEHRRDSKLSINPANEFFVVLFDIIGIVRKVLGLRDIIPKVLEKLLQYKAQKKISAYRNIENKSRDIIKAFKYLEIELV